MAHLKLTKIVASLAVTGALTVAVPSIALADDGHGQGSVNSLHSSGNEKSDNDNRFKNGEKRPVDSLKAQCLREVDRRLTELDKLLDRVANDDTATPAHKAALTAALNSAKTGLGALRAEIDADTDATELKNDCQRIFSDFRVYAFRIPQVNLVLAADRAQAQQAKFADLKTKLQQAITDAAGNPNVTKAQNLLTDFDAKVAAGVAGAAGVADAAVVLTPADWNANHNVLKPFITTMKQVKNDFRAASKDAHLIIAVLKGEGEKNGIDKD
jgi:hypothetical protein